MNWLAWVADVAILGSYYLFVSRGWERPFHWANALGCIPLLVVELQSGATQVVPVTAAFGLIGWYGILSRP